MSTMTRDEMNDKIAETVTPESVEALLKSRRGSLRYQDTPRARPATLAMTLTGCWGSYYAERAVGEILRSLPTAKLSYSDRGISGWRYASLEEQAVWKARQEKRLAKENATNEKRNAIARKLGLKFDEDGDLIGQGYDAKVLTLSVDTIAELLAAAGR